jgi:hypothetical protein
MTFLPRKDGVAKAYAEHHYHASVTINAWRHD